MSSLSELRTKKAAPWSWLVAELGNPDLTGVVLFCAIGLFATILILVSGSWGDRRPVLIA
jgi:hypothetical protein